MMKRLVGVFVVCLTLLAITPAFAQCPMCKSNVEQSRKAGSNAARGLNNGILYLLAMPYLFVGGIGYWWYRRQKSLNQG